MQLRTSELDRHLAGGLAPVYLIAGDETLLVEEACDAVLAAARRAGFDERSVHHAEGGFQWHDLLQDAASLSLFAARRIVDVRVPGNKLERDGAEVLRGYAAAPPADTLLLLRTGRLEAKQKSSAWFRAIDAGGVIVQVWPVTIPELPRWLAGRAKAAGLALEPEALALLAERVEGNLLAAVQELRKLAIAGLPSPIGVAALQAELGDAARYDTFDLIDSTFAGDARRVVRMLRTLRQEGVAPFAVLGALTAQLRRLGAGDRLPPQRQRLVGALLNRLGSAEAVERVLAECALVDAQGKGQFPGDAWVSLEDLLLRLCGVRPLAVGSPTRLLR